MSVGLPVFSVGKCRVDQQELKLGGRPKLQPQKRAFSPCKYSFVHVPSAAASARLLSWKGHSAIQPVPASRGTLLTQTASLPSLYVTVEEAPDCMYPENGTHQLGTLPLLSQPQRNS